MMRISTATVRSVHPAYAAAGRSAAMRASRHEASRDRRTKETTLKEDSSPRRGVWSVIVLILLSLAGIASIFRRHGGGDDGDDSERKAQSSEARITAPMGIVRPESSEAGPVADAEPAGTIGGAARPPWWGAVVERVRSAAAEADEVKRRESSLRRLVGSSFGKAADWVAEAAMADDWQGKVPRFNWMQPAYLNLIAHRLIERDDDLYETAAALCIALAAYCASLGDDKRTEIGVRAVQAIASDNPEWAEFFLQEMSWKDRFFSSHSNMARGGEVAGETYGVDDILSHLVQGIVAARGWQKSGSAMSLDVARMHAASVIGKLAVLRSEYEHEYHPKLARLAVRLKRMCDDVQGEMKPAALWVKKLPLPARPTPEEIAAGAPVPITTAIDAPAGVSAKSSARQELSSAAYHAVYEVVHAINGNAELAGVTETILASIALYWGNGPMGDEARRSLQRMRTRDISALIASGAELAGISYRIPLDRDREFACISLMHHLARAGMYYHASTLAISRPVKVELLSRGGARGALAVVKDLMPQAAMPEEIGRYVELFERLVDKKLDGIGGGTGGGGAGPAEPDDEPDASGKSSRRSRNFWESRTISVDQNRLDMIQTAPSITLAWGALSFLGARMSMSMSPLRPVAALIT